VAAALQCNVITSPPSRAISERVARNVPHRRDPERFHVEKVCISQDLERIADEIEERSTPAVKVERTRKFVAAARHYFRGDFRQ
jgi:hypothetical protein